ncbi:MAG: hypothetical protein AMS16_03885 [Planctomycetes bacterium DG_58]|nr:MAG: hypothetical protein AMS16_03885 [Planctomycetes bacterium DG_58]
MRILARFAVIVVVVLFSGAFFAAGAAGPVGVVSNVKVLSDKVEDMSNLEAWKKTYIKEGMTNEEKALAIWKTVVKYRHQTSPPNEWLQLAGNVHDFMKTVHVYGYGMCCCASANIEQLGRYIGFGARGRIISGHSVPELYYDGKWHLLDASLINYFKSPDGSIASVEELITAVTTFRKENRDTCESNATLRKFARDWGWKKGPPLLASTEFYSKDGPNFAGTHGWIATMSEYDCKRNQVYEYGYSQGYRPNVQLRPGERLTRNWFNKGLHVNMKDGKGPDILKTYRGMGYWGKLGLGRLTPGRVGNGIHEYAVPVGDASLRLSALSYENLAAQDGKLRVAAANQPGVLVIRMPSSYVYLSGEINLKAAVGPGGDVVVSFSDNNGLDWKEVAKIEQSGDQKIDLTSQCFRHYDYRLKFEMKGAGTGLDALNIRHDVQHSQLPLPGLRAGRNTITFSSGPQEGTVTIEGNMDPEGKAKGRQVLITDFHPVLENMQPKTLRVQEYNRTGGSATFTLESPGDMTRIRMGAHWRARDQREGWIMQVSFDDGQTWQETGHMGGNAGCCTYVTYDEVPKETRKALIRYKTTRMRNTLCLFDLRVDADYTEPNGGFRPVKVTYVWTEDGEEKRDVRVAKKPNETYTITCAKEPLMKSLIVELAD